MAGDEVAGEAARHVFDSPDLRLVAERGTVNAMPRGTQKVHAAATQLAPPARPAQIMPAATAEAWIFQLFAGGWTWGRPASTRADHGASRRGAIASRRQPATDAGTGWAADAGTGAGTGAGAWAGGESRRRVGRRAARVVAAARKAARVRRAGGGPRVWARVPPRRGASEAAA